MAYLGGSGSASLTIPHAVSAILLQFSFFLSTCSVILRPPNGTRKCFHIEWDNMPLSNLYLTIVPILKLYNQCCITANGILLLSNSYNTANSLKVTEPGLIFKPCPDLFHISIWGRTAENDWKGEVHLKQNKTKPEADWKNPLSITSREDQLDFSTTGWGSLPRGEASVRGRLDVSRCLVVNPKRFVRFFVLL